MKWRSGSDEMAWAFAFTPAPQELLSGYLCRVSLAHGASPFSFFNLHLADPEFWARDIDRSLARDHHLALAELSGLSSYDLSCLGLGNWITKLHPSNDRTDYPNRITPWINAVGIRQRSYKLHGLQYCPLCLAANGWINRSWRLSFVIVCAEHHCWLRDACPHCDAPFVPHQAKGRDFKCHACGEDLCHGFSSNRIRTSGKGLALFFQSAMLDMLTAPDENSAGKEMTPSVLRDLVSLFCRRSLFERTLRTLKLDVPQLPHSRFRLETARFALRKAIVCVCAKLAEDWPQSFHDLNASFNLTQRSFGKFGPWPDELRFEIEKLPTGYPKRRIRGMSGLMKGIRRLELKRPVNWRARRANQMFRAAKVSR